MTNTIWWQDFPLRKTPDYSALFGTLEVSKSDFAAQLAGFIATLISDVPSQAHWIKELTKYDFGGAVGHLVASIPGLHAEKSGYYRSNYYMSAKESVHSVSRDMKFLGSVQASVVGLSHRFRSTTDSNGAQLKTLASVLRKYQENNTGNLEVILKRSTHIPADANAVSVHVADLDEFVEGDCMQLGFLPKDVAQWVSPLSDGGFFSFSGFIQPKEALAAAFDGSNMKVQLLLNVAQGPKFSEMSRLMQSKHIAPLCSLLASIQKCLGLWRLQEVLSQYKWPESLEADFIYGCSSIGTSVNAQFLASFSAAAGKRSFQISESEESDPEWGRWNTHLEIQNPSMRILFPTIERVKNGACGIPFSRRMISFSEQTWQRMKATGIFHDAIPQPDVRAGYPTHVKIARRRFQYKTGGPSFGWIYCGSHNFSPAAWGHRIFPSSEAKMPVDTITTKLGPRLHICNYELGIVLIAPPDISDETQEKSFDLDDIILPFVMPAPKYRGADRPATAQAMREALASMAVIQRDNFMSEIPAEEIDEDIAVEDVDTLEASSFLAEEKEEEKIYAEMLWSQVDSVES